MGVKLYVEALDHAPRECKGSELVTLLVLCEDARDSTRRGWPGMDKLRRRTRCEESTVRGHLAKLEERKLIKRLDAPTRQPGAKPVVAHRGRRTVYEIAPMTDSSHTKAPGSQRHPDPERGQDPAERRQDPSGKAPGSWPPSPPAPAASPPGPVAIGPDVVAEIRDALRERTGRDVGDAWALRVAANILSGRGGVASPVRYVRASIERETDLQRFMPVPEV